MCVCACVCVHVFVCVACTHYVPAACVCMHDSVDGYVSTASSYI